MIIVPKRRKHQAWDSLVFVMPIKMRSVLCRPHFRVNGPRFMRAQRRLVYGYQSFRRRPAEVRQWHLDREEW